MHGVYSPSQQPILPHSLLCPPQGLLPLPCLGTTQGVTMQAGFLSEIKPFAEDAELRQALPASRTNSVP